MDKSIQIQKECMLKLGISENIINEFINNYKGKYIVSDLVELEKRYIESEKIDLTNKIIKSCIYWSIDKQTCELSIDICENCKSYLHFDFIDKG